MRSAPQASTAVVVAAVFAILLGALGAFSTLTAIIVFSFSNLPNQPAYPEFMKPFLLALWTFLLLCSIFVAVVGVQVIQLRNWARISLLVIAGCLLFFGLVGIFVIFVAVFATPSSDPRVPKELLAAVLGLTYGIPIATALWWLMLFTRRSVVAQFQAVPSEPPAGEPQAYGQSAVRLPGTTNSVSRWNNPLCPLGVRIVGWYLASFVLLLPFIPFVPNRFPTLFFGHVFHGPAAIAVYFSHFALLSVAGVGLLLLKRWSYPLAIVSQLLVCANGVFLAYGNGFETAMRAMMEGMQLPELPPETEFMFHNLRYFMWFGLVIPIAILVTLIASRRRFYAALEKTESAA